MKSKRKPEDECPTGPQCHDCGNDCPGYNWGPNVKKILTKKRKPRTWKAWASIHPKTGELSKISGDTVFMAIYPSKKSGQKDIDEQYNFWPTKIRGKDILVPVQITEIIEKGRKIK